MSRIIAVIYGVITCGFIAAIISSGRCWQYQGSHGLPDMALHDRCLEMWFASGGLLTLSQVAFVGIALEMKDSVGARILILTCSTIILLGIGGYVFLLTQMPS